LTKSKLIILIMPVYMSSFPKQFLIWFGNTNYTYTCSFGWKEWIHFGSFLATFQTIFDSWIQYRLYCNGKERV